MRVAHFLLLGVVVLLAFLLRPPPYILHDVEALPALPNVPRVSLRAEVLLQGLGVEDVLFHAGDAFAGLMEGDFVRFDKERFEAHTVLQKRSRPSLFSGKVSRDGRFWFVFAQTGLASFSLDASKKKIIDLRLHALDVDDGTSAINFPNHLDVHPDGRIFFSDSYQREIPNQGVMTTLVEVLFSGERSGRLLAHDPSKNSTRTILGGLSFANGVAVSPDGSFVAVAETMKSRIWRVWLTGPKAGSSEIWISNLPGYPDNLSSDGKHLYVALGLLRNSVSEFIYSNVWARTVLPRLPSPPIGADPGGFVRIDWSSSIHQSFEKLFIAENVPGCTSVVPHNGYVYLSSYFAKGYVARIPLAQIA